jgi:proteasome alpha subunit
VSMPFYASAEQIMRDRSEYARKGIARGRSVVVMTYADGVLFVAENASSALHKVSEIYDRIAFAAVGKYNEFENLRVAGIRLADLRGYSYDRRDVTARALANAYAQTLGTIFTEQQKPYEVEICVAEVGAMADQDQLYRLSYDGTIVDEPEFLVMGGQAEAITTEMRRTFTPGLDLSAALAVAVAALGSTGGPNGGVRTLPAAQLEVAVLDRNRPARTFRRIVGAALTALLPAATGPAAEPVPAPADTPPHDANPDEIPAGERAAAGPAVPGGRPSKPASSVQLPDDTSLGVEPGQPPPEPGIDPSPGAAQR